MTPAPTPHLHNSEEAAQYYRDLLAECREWIRVAENDYANHFGAHNAGTVTATKLVEKIDHARNAWR